MAFLHCRNTLHYHNRSYFDIMADLGLTYINKTFICYILHQSEIIVSYLYNSMGTVKKISNDQELIQSDPISCPQNQKGNN